MLEKLHSLRSGSWRARLLGRRRDSRNDYPEHNVRHNARNELDSVSSVRLNVPFDFHDDSDAARKELTCIERLEKKCRRLISVETDQTAENLEKCCLQQQSPLWKLPAEIRNIIWQLVTTAEELDAAAGNQVPKCQKVHTNIMKTCRRAWLEINGIALQQTDLHFFCSSTIYGIGFAQDPRRDAQRLWNFLRVLTYNNRQQLNRLSIFAPLWWFEGPYQGRLPLFLKQTGVCPRVLELVVSVTPELLVRVSDNGDNQSDLEMGWLRLLLDMVWPERLRMIRMTLNWTNGVLKQLLFGPKVNLLHLVVENLRKLDQVSSSAGGSDGPARKLWHLEEPPVGQDNFTVGSLESGFPKHVRSLHRGDKSAPRSQSVTLVWRAAKSSEEQQCSLQADTATSRSTLRSNYSMRKCLRKWKKDDSLLKFLEEPLKPRNHSP